MADPRDFSRPDTTQQFRPDRTTALQPAASAPALNMVPGILPQPAMLDQASTALKALMPELDQFIAKQDKEYSEQEIQAGREAALKEAKEYGAAVKSGALAPNQSKWFMKGYKAQYGEATGQQWALEAKTAWTQSEARNSDDPNAAASFIRDFTAKKLATAAGMDPDVRAGLLPQLSNMHGAVMAAQAEYSAKQVYDKNLELLGTNITSDIDEYINSHGKMSTAELYAKIKSRDAGGRLMGVQNDDLNKTIAEAFAQKARAAGSVSLLKVVQGYDKVGNNPKYLGILRVAEDAITNKQLALENRALAMEARNVRVQGQRALMNVFTGLLDQQKAGKVPTLTNDMIAGLKASGNPEAGVQAMKLMQEQAQEFQKPTAQEMSTIYNRIAKAGPQGAFNEANLLLTDGILKGPEGAKLAYGLAKEFADKHIQSDPLFTSGSQMLQNYSSQSEYGKAMIDPRASADAVDGFQREFSIWSVNHPAATDVERGAARNDILKRYQDQLDSFKMGEKYTPGSIAPKAADTSGVQHKSTEDLLKMLGPNAGSVTGESLLRTKPSKPNQRP